MANVISENPIEVLCEEVQEQLTEPAMLLSAKTVRSAVEAVGGLGLSVPTPTPHIKPYLLPTPLTFFLGVTSSKNRLETRHMHPLQDEAYIVMDGHMEIHAWTNTHRRLIAAAAGDLVVVPKGSFHYVQQVDGWVYVVKAPLVWGEAAKIEDRG